MQRVLLLCVWGREREREKGPLEGPVCVFSCVLLCLRTNTYSSQKAALPSPPRAPDFERGLGLVLVPRRYITAMLAMESEERVPR